MSRETIMVMCAHSDDEILGPGATLAKYAKQGKKIITIIFSYGVLSLPHFKPEIVRKIRVDEARKADKVIGGSGVFFLGLDDVDLLTNARKKNVPEKLVQLIKKYHPAKIFTHSMDDLHPNHRDVHSIVDQVLKKIDYKPEFYTFDVWNPFNFRRRHLPKLYIDVTDTFRIKLKALGCFESQFSVATFLNFWPFIMMYIKALINGHYVEGKYAERFCKVR